MHCIIGVWGMGGVGKTHLLKQINNELCKDGAFNIVVFVTCSKECSEEKVQNEIINTLGLHKNNSMEQKQSTIHKFLSKQNFVLLLDDLWDRVDLDKIGIPNLSSKRKVVLTTRSTEICGQMEAQKRIKVDILSEHDAWSLFKERATEETINSDPLIQKCSVEVVKELGRLPLALITVGRAMHDKLDPREWEQAVVLLKQARIYDVEFSRSNMSIFHTLKFSYDNLKNDALKRCFLHCSLWPEDWEIEKGDLVELWMGLGLIDEPEIQTAYNIGYSYIRRLQAVCLLEESYYDDADSIKMHDVIRDMALWIARDQGVENCKWIVQARTYKERRVMKVSQETEKLSLMLNETEEFPLFIPCSSNKLSTLLLRSNGLKDAKNLRLESFCELTVLDLSDNEFESFPIEICKLVQLQFLNLSWNKQRIKSLPKEFEDLINLKYLLLRETRCTIPEGVVSKLKALRVLDSSYCYNDFNWQREDNLQAFSSLEEELQCLPEFQALGISIFNMQDFQKLSQMLSVPVRWLNILNLQYLSFTSGILGNFQLQSNLTDLYINGWDLEWVKFERASDDHSTYCLGRLEQLCFENTWQMKEVVWKGLNPNDVFPRLQVLIFGECKYLKSISWVVFLPCIRELTVKYCESMKKLICIGELNDDAIRISQPSFPFLKEMTLKCNYDLESISDPMITFPALEFLSIDTCNKLKKLPFKTSTPPKKLKLMGSEEWWNNIEMESSNHRSLLQPFFREW